MALRIYNTRTRRKAEFRANGPVRMYVCGPTVYAPAHMGHARSYVAFDVIRRYLAFLGHDVRYVVNVTDVEDTITDRARELGMRAPDLAAKYADEWLADMAALGLEPAQANPRVSDHIPEILAVAQDLVAAGKAYVADGNVYLDAGDGRGFGFLTHTDPHALIADAGGPKGKKRHPLDFVIWKRATDDRPSWESPWGRGYPGWHVECYAMARKHLGSVDLHGGGRDLIFPHHESENVIAREHSGHDFAKVWMHNGWLTLETEKMSKSLGNGVPIRDVLATVPGEVARLCLAKIQYRENAEYDKDCFKITAKELETIRGAVAHVKSTARPGGPDPKVAPLIEGMRARFLAAMDDDFDTNTAFYSLLQFAEGLRETAHFTTDDRDRILEVVRGFGAIFGVTFSPSVPA